MHNVEVIRSNEEQVPSFMPPQVMSATARLPPFVSHYLPLYAWQLCFTVHTSSFTPPQSLIFGSQPEELGAVVDRATSFSCSLGSVSPTGSNHRPDCSRMLLLPPLCSYRCSAAGTTLQLPLPQQLTASSSIA